MRGAVLWDLDGTLVDSEPLHARATDEVLATLGLAPRDGFHERALGLPSEAVHALLVAETGLSLDAADWDARKFDRFAALAAELPVREPAAGLVARIAARGVAQAVVSNSTRAEVDLALKATGLAEHLRLAISRDDLGRGKPDPEGYLAAAAALGADPRSCLVIEDSHTGAAAGLAAGMRVIFHPQHDLDGPAGAITLPPGGDLAALIDADLSRMETT